MRIINPATEELIREVKEDSEASLASRFNLLKKGQSDWARKDLQERIDVLKKFADLLSSNKDHLAEVLTSEVGKPLQQSFNELSGARARITWITDNAARFLSEETMHEEKGLVEKIRYEPLGVICNISAWNYPYLVGVNVFVPALIAGNTVMYKPSEHATLTGLEIEKLLREAGVPENAFQAGIGAREVGEFLLDLPFDGYFFTGSYKTGKYIYERVAPKMVPCQCELGGKDPIYIAEDISDVRAVAAATADGAFYNNGQSCCAVERIYVHESIYDAYISEFVKEVKSWKTGLPTEAGVYLGPLTRKDQLAILEEQVDEAVQRGAKVLVGGRRLQRKGYYFEPTVITGVSNDMRVMKEESFGPIIGITKVKDDEEAMRLMQDNDYGLTAGVYSQSRQRAESILARINAGTGYWNCCDRVSASVPWSGRNRSGFGSTLSHQGIRAFTRPKAYHLKG
jgi:acyl-CoA reductase-like NAD-dependent aldehyde dehydrogenase